MLAYRLQKSKYNSKTLEGTGAFLTGGRWNPVGTPLVYTSTTTSLAVLEWQAHINRSLIHTLHNLNFAVLELPDECVMEFEVEDLPPGWDSVPSSGIAQDFLLPYLDSGAKLAYKVPSVVNPYESNILIDPLHPDIGRVIEKKYLKYLLDLRSFAV